MNERTPRRSAVTRRQRAGVAMRSKQRVGRVACLVVAAAMIVLMAGTASAQGATSQRYSRLWDGVSEKNKRWARHTSECESGGDPKAHGGGGAYHGAFQFRLSTWRHAPKSPGGEPHKETSRTQAVVAVYLKKRDGAKTHWGGCG